VNFKIGYATLKYIMLHCTKVLPLSVLVSQKHKNQKFCYILALMMLSVVNVKALSLQENVIFKGFRHCKRIETHQEALAMRN